MRLILLLIIAGMCVIPATIYSETKRENMKPPIPLTSLKKRTVVKGEYIVTLSAGAGKNFLLYFFSKYHVVKTRKIGRGLYLIKITDDPGLDALKGYARKNEKIKDIQPNFVYRALNSK
jgi:hypothetical protein